VARWGRRENLPIHITAVDTDPEIVKIAREKTASFPEIAVREGDLFKMRLQEDAFDYVTASLFLHHCAPGRTAHALRVLDSLARRGVIVSDLLRSARSYRAVTFLSWTAGNRVVRHDGPLSVRRAFTRHELQALAQDAGLAYLKAGAHPWFRLSLAGEKAHDARQE
jgi:SAM-dependent methyltransferase